MEEEKEKFEVKFSSPFIEERLYFHKLFDSKTENNGSRPLLSRSGCILKNFITQTEL